MSTSNFDFLRSFIKKEAAIIIEPGKEYLVDARLTPLVKEFGLGSVDELLEQMRTKPTEIMKHRIVDAMTTNETFFFRDIHPFDLLKNHVLPDLIAKKQKEKKLSIWCAAASSGQEPYTIAMILKDYEQQLKGWTIEFIASDLSEKMLVRSKEGIYNQLEVNRGLPMPYLVKYFEKVGTNWQLKQDIREMISFRKINLMHDWKLGSMDLIFMRNVLIYFDIETKKDIMKRVERILLPHGYLFLGGSETMLGITEDFKRIGINKVPCYQLGK